MGFKWVRACRAVLVTLFMLASTSSVGRSAQEPPPAAPLAKQERELLHKMLRDAHDLVRDRYYDIRKHGLDWDARWKEYDARLDAVTSLNRGVTLVAAFLDGLNDSHTALYPPSRPYTVDYGYRMYAVGERVFVRAVTPKGDAEGKLRIGDEILAINAGEITRDTLPTFSYLVALQPQSSTTVRVRGLDGVERVVTVNAAVSDKPAGRKVQSLNPRFLEEGLDPAQAAKEQAIVEHGDVLIWRFGSFIMTPADITRGVEAASRHRALVLDLRGNRGGYTFTLHALLGHFFDRTIVLGTAIGRTGRTTEKVSKTGPRIKGTVVVLVDSRSASAAEIFARAIQLQGRGVVIGDRSAGAVMTGQIFAYSSGSGAHVVPYIFSVTVGDFRMSDGESLEHTGVVPDDVVLPTGADLATGADPAMARALAACGVTVTPAEAGLLARASGR